MFNEYFGNVQFMCGCMKADSIRGKNYRENFWQITDYYIRLLLDNKISNEEYEILANITNESFLFCKNI